jgi:hypothetical protein
VIGCCMLLGVVLAFVLLLSNRTAKRGNPRLGVR